jgi:hypothetical protein
VPLVSFGPFLIGVYKYTGVSVTEQMVADLSAAILDDSAMEALRSDPLTHLRRKMEQLLNEWMGEAWLKGLEERNAR